MAFNPLIGMSQELLETKLTELQRKYLALYQSTSAGDQSSSIVSQQAEIMARITDVLRALSIIDPDTYPPDSVNRITTTKASFPAL